MARQTELSQYDKGLSSSQNSTGNSNKDLIKPFTSQTFLEAEAEKKSKTCNLCGKSVSEN